MKHTFLESNLDEWINASLDGKLNKAEQLEFDHYLATHPEAREAYEETQAMNRLLEKTLKKDQPDLGFEDRMVHRFRKGKQSRDLGFWKNWAWLWQGHKTVYAGALAALVLSFYIGEMNESGKAKLDDAPNIVVQNNGGAKVEVVQDFKYPDPNGYEKPTVSQSAEAQAEVTQYFNSPDPIHYVPPGTPLKEGNVDKSGFVLAPGADNNSNTLGREVIDRPSNLNVTYGNLFANMIPLWHTGVLSSYKPQSELENVIGVKLAQEAKFKSGGSDRGDFNLNALKIVLEKPPSDENNLQAGFRTDIRMGEAEVPVNMDRVRGAVFLNDANSVRVAQQEQANKSRNEVGDKKTEAGKTQTQPARAPVNSLPPEPKTEKKADEKGFQSNVESVEVAAEIQRKLIRNANLGLEVKSYAAAIRDLTRLAADEKGFVATQNDLTQANGHSAGQVVIKLPPDRLDEFVLRLRELGTVQRQVLKMDDVTKAYFDTDARLRNARKTEERLLELMAKKTDKVADLLQVEKEIGRVRESIEQMQGELKLWDSLASLATVTIDLVEQDMDQAAAYLLKETATLNFYSADVEKSYKEARELAEKSEAQIVAAQVSRGVNGQMSANLSLLAAPDKAFYLVEQLKALGRVQSFVQDTQRVAQDGRSGITGTTRRDKVEIQVVIMHDDASRKTVTLQVVTPDVEKALDQCKKVAAGGEGEVLASNLQRRPDGHSLAELTVRIPAKRLDETKAFFSGQGRVVRLSVDRSDEAGANSEKEDSAPVILSLSLSDEEPPVQLTRLDIEGDKVGSKVEELKKRARDLGIEIRASSFIRQPNGVEQANLVFRMTQKEYVGMLESLLATGKTLNMALERSDRMDSEKTDEANEPVEVLFRLKSPAPLVENEDGFVGAVKHTLVKSFNVLGGSLQRVVTGFAYLLPWLLVGGAGWFIWKGVKRRK